MKKSEKLIPFLNIQKKKDLNLNLNLKKFQLILINSKRRNHYSHNVLAQNIQRTATSAQKTKRNFMEVGLFF